MSRNPSRLCLQALGFFSCLFSGGCRDTVYPLPTQYVRPAYRLRQFLEMGGIVEFPWASITGGVMPAGPGLNWSWTYEHPAFLFRLDQKEGWDLEMKLTAPEVVLAKTGPQHVAVFVNDILTGTAVLDRSRSWELRFPVRPEVLTHPADTRVTLAIEPCLPQAEGPPLCTLLHRIGFSRDLASKDSR